MANKLTTTKKREQNFLLKKTNKMAQSSPENSQKAKRKE